MIICKRQVHQDDHCKRPVDQDNHLQEAGLSDGSFARGQSIRMIICKRPANSDDHLQEVHLDDVYGWSVFVVGRCLLLVIANMEGWVVYHRPLLVFNLCPT